MKEEFRYFIKHYLLLTLLLLFGLGSMIYFRSNQDLAEVILWVTIGGYTAWGIGHHLVRKDLTTMIVIEYFLVGIIAGFVIQALLFV